MTTIFKIATAVALAVGFGGQVAAQTIGTAGVPTGFGIAGGTLALSMSGSYGPERTGGPNPTNGDASGSVLLGFGNPVSGLGVQGGVNVTSFRNFGASGYLSFGVHKMFQANERGVYSIALNGSHLAPWGDAERLDPGASLVGSYLTSLGGNLAMISLGAATDTNNARDVEGIFGFGIGVSQNVAVSIGQIGNDRTAVGVSFAPSLLGGNTLSVSVNHNHRTNDNTLVVDIGRAFGLFKQ